MDILGLVKEQLTNAAISKISGFLGESEAGTTSALGAALPSVLAGLMEKGSTTQGASDIMNALKTGDSNSGIFDNLSGLLSGDSSSGLLGNGLNLLNMVFGNKLGNLTNVISNVSGLGSGSTSKILQLAAPMLMGVIGKQVSSKGLSVSGLTSLLMSQKDSVKAALPSGLGNVLNLASLGSTVGGATKKATNYAAETVEETKSGFSKFLPWILLGLGLLAALYFWRSCENKGAQVVDSVDSTATAVVSGVDSVASLMKKTLSTGVELSFGENSIENDLISFIEDDAKVIDKTTWFNFKNLKFATGSAQLDSTSMMEVTNIAEIMKAFPNVNIKIGGYTDNVGNADSNKKLSADRAVNVLGSLVSKGIDKARLESEGYGQEHPIASNETAEGKAQNRRIAVRVTKK